MKRTSLFLITVSVPAFLFLTLLLGGARHAYSAPDAVCAVPATYATIQAAVDDTNCTEINVAAGTYTETVVVDRSLSLAGAGADTTVIDGNQSGSVISITTPAGSGSQIEISGFTLQNGLAAEGGGIYIGSSLHVAVRDVTIENNEADFGGGIWADEAIVLIENALIRRNHSNSSGGGGGIYNRLAMTIRNSRIIRNTSAGLLVSTGGGGINNRGDITITHSTIARNTAEQSGGGWFDETFTHVRMIGVEIRANTAGTLGGGIRTFADSVWEVESSSILNNELTEGLAEGGGIYTTGVMTFSNSLIQANETPGDGGGLASGIGANIHLQNTIVQRNIAGAGGGGIHVNQSPLRLYDSDVFDNRAADGGGGLRSSGDTLMVRTSVYSNTALAMNGGGIYVLSGGSLTIRESAIYSNSTPAQGGGIYATNLVTLTNSTVSENDSGGDGGGLYLLDGGSLDSLTIADNYSETGTGGLHASSVDTTTIVNSALVSNTYALGPFECSGNFDSGGYNFVGVTNFFCDTTSDFDQPTDIVDQRGRLGSLADNGGLTWTNRPRSGSPLVDNGICLADEDQRGNPRPDGDGVGSTGCDIGAFERGMPAAPVTPVLTPTVDGPDLHLAWSVEPENELYHVGWALNPYPAGEIDFVTTIDETAYSFYGVLGDPGLNYTFLLRAENAVGTATQWQKLGTFNFALVPGG